MYQTQRVAWKIVINADGSLVNFVPLTGSGKRADVGMELLAPHRVRAAAIKPKLLCDNAEYVLGIAREDEPDPVKVAERHRQFVELVALCAERTGEKSVEAVATFLRAWDAKPRPTPKGLTGGSIVTFEVEGTLPIDLGPVRAFWAGHTRGVTTDARTMTCLVCGERKLPEERHPKKIKGIPDGQTSGTSLISANSNAFESYGLEASLTSPTCRECAEAFADALNDLLASPRSSLRIGPVVYAYWTKAATEFDPFAMLVEPDGERVGALLRSAKHGRSVNDLVSEVDFFLVALSASGARVVVRDYVETNVDVVKSSLARWFRFLEPFQGKTPLGLRALAGSLVREFDDLPPNVLPALARVALAGGRAPPGLLHLVARRNAVEGGPTRPRAALARIVLVTDPNNGYTEDRFMALETENTDPAYLCGRLFAEIANAQRAALGETNVTVVDRYYGTASSAPAVVFGPLLRDTQRAYLPKLHTGARIAIEQRIQEIASKMPARFPATLDLKGQAIFSLGFHHQRAASFEQIKARREAKARAASEGDENDA